MSGRIKHNNRRVLALAAAVVLTAFMPNSASAEEWKSYTKLNSGLAGNSVASIALDPDGETVWFGSGEEILFTGPPGSRGVSRYQTSTDRWTVFNTGNGLTHNSVFSIEADSRFVWFGTRRGISRYEKKTGVWTAVDSTNSLLGESVIRQLKKAGDDLWVVTNAGKVYRQSIDSAEWTDFPLDEAVLVNQLAVDDGCLWFATSDGLHRYDRASSIWTRFSILDGLLDKNIACLAVDELYVWAGTQNGVSRLKKTDAAIVNFTSMSSDLASNRITAIAAEQHVVWFVTESNGVCRLNKDTQVWSVFNPENSGLAENTVLALVCDSRSVWFGTKNKGISRYEKNASAWTVLNKSGGLASNNVFSVSVDTGYVWLGTDGGLTRFERSTGLLRQYTVLNSGLSDNSILSSSVDKDVVWLGTEMGGLCKYDVGNEHWDVYDVSNSGIADNYVQCIAVDDQDVWLGSPGQGLSRYSKKDKKWKRYYSDSFIFSDRIPSNDVRSLAIDSRYLWVGYLHSATFGGMGDDEAVLSRYEKSTGKWYHFTGDFFTGTMLAGNNVQTLGIDGNIVWIGFFEPWSGAMNRYNTATGAMGTVTYEDGLADRNVWSIGVDQRFDWFGTGSGVNRYDKKKNILLTFNVSDGVSSNWIRSIGIDGSRVWLGTLGGGVTIFQDQSAPALIHEPVSDKKAVNQSLTLSARIEENIAVTDVWLFYRPKVQAWFDSVRMENRMGDFWSAEIPAAAIRMEGLEYYLKAEDGYNSSYHPWGYPAAGAHSIDTYDDTPPACTLTIRPEQNKGFIFPNDQILLDGQVDGTFSIPTVRGVALDEFSSAGSMIRRTAMPPGTVLLEGEGTVKTVQQSLKIGGLDPATASIGIELTIHESDSVKDQAFLSNRILVLQDNDFPLCYITDPKAGAEIGSNTAIRGTVYDANFSRYWLDYGVGKSPGEWHAILVPQASVAQIDTILGIWYTLDLADTLYTIRLSAMDLASHVSSDSVAVRVKKIPIYAARGGTVISSDGSVTLRLSPNAIDRDTPIFINGLDQLPTPVDPELAETGLVFRFLPAEMALKKPATVTFCYTAAASRVAGDESSLSIFNWNEDAKEWMRLGGTIDREVNTISTVIEKFGDYAILIDSRAPEEKPSLTELDCQPRLFSPRSDGFGASTAISFHLGAHSEVSIKIYNTAGRLERVLKESEAMLRGDNVVEWDGKDRSGQICASGLYIVAIEAAGRLKTKTVVVLNK